MRLLQLLSILAVFFLMNCSNPTSSSKRVVISIAEVSITNLQDTDGDGYYTDARLNFDVDINRGDVLIDAFLWRRETGTDTFYLYGYIEQILIEGENSSDASYFTIGYPYEALPHANYDFLLEIYSSDTPDDLIADVSAADPGFEFMGNIGFEPKFQLTFINPVFTDIDVQVYGYGTGTIPAGSSLVFALNQNPGIFTYYAVTSGKTNTGGQIGLEISWNFQHNVSTLNAASYSLVVPSTYFFIYVRNDGTKVLNPFYVNFGNPTYETMDNIILPPDGITYRTGYYHAIDNSTEIRAIWQGEGSNYYTYWIEGTHFNLLFSDNQSITLLNQFKNAENVASGVTLPPGLYETAEFAQKGEPPLMNLPHLADVQTDYGKSVGF